MSKRTRMRTPATTLLLCLLLVALALPASAQTSDDDIGDGMGYETVTGLSEPEYTQWTITEHRVATAHGTLYGVIQRPVVPDDVQVPVILTYSPYNSLSDPVRGQESQTGNLDGLAGYYVPRGYARAFFDLVGTGESGGCTDFGGIRERETGATLVDWLGTREWSNGRVGMIGGSYDGTTQYAAAIEQPEHLTTIVPQVAIDRWWDYPYDGGVRRFSGFGTPLAFDYAFGMTPATSTSDPAHSAEVAQARINPCERAHNQIRGYGYDPIYDSFWDERDYRAVADRVQASVLVEGGWLDTNVQGVGSVRFWQALPEDHPKKLVMGQWGHSSPTLEDWQDVRHAWFDYWLLGYDGSTESGLPDTGVMDLPRVDSEVSTDERFQSDTWPPAGTEEQVLELTASGGTTWQSHDGSVITLQTAPFEADTRIAGAPYLDVTVTSDSIDAHVLTADTQLVVVLDQVRGSTTRRIATGMLNSRNRFGERTSVDLADGETWEGTVELDLTDHVVPEGASLRLRVTSWSGGAGPDVVPDDDAPVTNALDLDGTQLRIDVAPYTSAGMVGTAAGQQPQPTDAVDQAVLQRLTETLEDRQG